jgi:hypothetical protein
MESMLITSDKFDELEVAAAATQGNKMANEEVVEPKKRKSTEPAAVAPKRVKLLLGNGESAKEAVRVVRVDSGVTNAVATTSNLEVPVDDEKRQTKGFDEVQLHNSKLFHLIKDA